MLHVVAAIALTSMLATHNSSEGTSRFVLGEQGQLDITLELLELDLPELCNVDVRSPGDHGAALDACVQRGLPSWLRVRVGDDVCRIGDPQWQRSGDLRFTITGSAACRRPTGQPFAIDWGLFAGHELAHINTSSITLPDRSTHTFMFSRRHNRFVVDVQDARYLRGIVGAGVGVVGSVVAAIVIVIRRRRRG